MIFYMSISNILRLKLKIKMMQSLLGKNFSTFMKPDPEVTAIGGLQL